MKTLYIVRHAKSSWDYPELPDEKRPLLEKGKKRTKRIIDDLLRRETVVDLIVSSPAVRAFETAKIIGNALRHAEERLFNLFFDLPSGVDTLMIVGHNPTLTNFANHFLTQKIDSIPTSGVVCIDFDTEKWEEIDNMNSKLRFFITPKMLKKTRKK